MFSIASLSSLQPSQKRCTQLKKKMDSSGAGGPKVTEHQIMNQMQTELQVAAMQEFFQV